jgi:hypothetical protein
VGRPLPRPVPEPKKNLRSSDRHSRKSMEMEKPAVVTKNLDVDFETKLNQIKKGFEESLKSAEEKMAAQYQEQLNMMTRKFQEISAGIKERHDREIEKLREELYKARQGKESSAKFQEDVKRVKFVQGN